MIPQATTFHLSLLFLCSSPQYLLLYLDLLHLPPLPQVPFSAMPLSRLHFTQEKSTERLLLPFTPSIAVASESLAVAVVEQFFNRKRVSLSSVHLPVQIEYTRRVTE